MFGLPSALAEKFDDFFFLVDSSITQGYFSKFRSNLRKWIEKQNIDASKHHVGLAQYDEDTNVEFLLNAFQTKKETLDGVKGFRLLPRPNKSHNLGRALEYAATHLFTSEAGGRAHLGSQQWLIIVIGKESDDPVSKAARKIKEAGILLAEMTAGATMNIIDLVVSSRGEAGQMHIEDLILTVEPATITKGEEHLPSLLWVLTNLTSSCIFCVYRQ